jgi:hypothetical protein
MSLDSLSSNTTNDSASRRRSTNRAYQHSSRPSLQTHAKPKLAGTIITDDLASYTDKNTNYRLDNTLLSAIITDVLVSPIVVISTTFSNLLIITLFIYSLLNQQATPLVAAVLMLAATYLVAVPIGAILAIRRLLRE